ncbi:MAG: recombination protein NinB [Halomonas sp.]|nr:recombination protein NinB [Halomonas sp.]
MSKELTYAVASQADIYPTLSQVSAMVDKGLPAGPVEIAVRRPGQKRSADQNRKLWAVLRDVSQQVEWYGRYLPDHAWKDIFTAALERQDIVPGIDGGYVMVGGRTSQMTKARFAELLTLIDAFGIDQGVRWSEPALEIFDEYKEAACTQ